MKRFFIGLLGVWIIYAALSLLAPPAATVNRHGLTLTEANLLRMTIILPLLFIWITALFGLVWFRRYSMLVKDSPEQAGYQSLTKGMWMLLAVIVLPSFLNVGLTYFQDSPETVKSLVIIRNYLTIALYMAGFVYLWQASKSLLGTINAEEWGKKYRTYVLAAVGVLTFVYTYLIFQNEFRTVSTDPLVRATYYLPDVLIMLTIVIPYFLIWLIGSMTILNFLSYAKQVPGLIFRQSFDYLAQGLGITIGLLILLQFLSQANASLNRSALTVIMIIIYFLLIAIAAGYLMIARGARKLAVIEEVK